MAMSFAYLLISNRKFALRLLVLIRIRLQFLNRIILQHRHRKLHIALGVLVPREDLGLIRQRGQRLVERRIHLLGVALKELAAPSMEQRVARKHNFFASVLHEPADAVLGVAWRVQALDGDTADLEAGAVGRCLGHAFGVFAGDDWQVGEVELGFLRVC